MNAAERNTFVGAQEGNLYGTAKTWASGIAHKELKVAATACVQEAARDRPLMKEVYLRLTGTMSVGDRLSGTPSDASHNFAGRNWKSFSEVETGRVSRNTDIYFENKREDAAMLCRAQADGCLQSVVRLNGGKKEKVTKTKEEAGVFFAVVDARTHAPLAAFARKGYYQIVTISANNVSIGWPEMNLANKVGALWPLRSGPGSKKVPLTINSKCLSYDVRVLRVDHSGHECPFVYKIARWSEWTGHATGWSVLVFRYHSRGNLDDGTFVCAAYVPANSPGFSFILYYIIHYPTCN